MTLKHNFSLLNIDYVQLGKSWNFTNIISPFYRIYLIDEGHGNLSNKGDEHILEAGFLYLIPSYTICNHHCTNTLSQYYLHFTEESPDGSSLFDNSRKIIKIASTEMDKVLFLRLLAINPNRGLRHFKNPKEYDKRPILRQFQEQNELSSLAERLETQGIILQLLARFLNKPDFYKQENSQIPSKVVAAIHYIQTHLHEPLSVAQLADQASLNIDYFSRIFTQHTGERPLTYILQKRIERSQFLLSTSKLSLSDIALEAGFDSLSYFSKSFKKITGQSPSAYQRSQLVE